MNKNDPATILAAIARAYIATSPLDMGDHISLPIDQWESLEGRIREAIRWITENAKKKS